MLILTRRIGESLVIGDDVILTVLGIKGNQIRIGIKAPVNVSVHREEIYDRINRQHHKQTTNYEKNHHNFNDMHDQNYLSDNIGNK